VRCDFDSLDIQGPFQIAQFLKYADPAAFATGDPVHRFFQMWQQTGGTNRRLQSFAWVAITTGQGGDTTGVTPTYAGQGAELMGFFNMATGDAPYFNSIAQSYALNQIENPDPAPGTANFYVHDGYSGGSYVNCSDSTQPAVDAILDKVPVIRSVVQAQVPPGTAAAVTDGITFQQTQPLLYNSIGDPHNGSAKVINGPLKNNLEGLASFYQDVARGTLPAVSYVVPKNLDSGHPRIFRSATL
jgi:hypothetical protein